MPSENLLLSDGIFIWLKKDTDKIVCNLQDIYNPHRCDNKETGRKPGF